jgi:DNA-binding transcriptional MocR family regulator
MKLKLDKNKATNLYIQVYEAIRDKILSEELAFGSRLLSERKLSQLLDVNRQTIATAYELLKVDGLIESFSGRGTFVSYKQEEKKHKKTINTYLNWPELFERKQRVRHGSLIELIMDEQLKRDTYFLAGGLPAIEAVPKEAFRQISSELLQDKHLNVLSQSPVSGVSQLKKQIKQIMWHRGYESKVDEYLITSGSQQALDLIFRAFLQPGDTVLIEEPSFFGVIELLKHYGAHIVSLPMDKEGMQTSILEYMLEKHRPKFIYTIPTYQNPTAISMSIERRKALIALSNKYNVGIIEDDPYGALQYEGKHYPTLKSMDLYSRKIIGWHLSDSLSTEGVIAAINKAKRNRKLTEPVVFHSDRGVQFVSKAFYNATPAEQFTHSYSRKGNPWDNACIEAFHSVIKREWLNRFVIKNLKHAHELIFEYIEGFYNTRRTHGACGLESPNNFEMSNLA